MTSTERIDPEILRITDDILRLGAVDDLDFHGMLLWRPEIDPRQPPYFLADGSFQQAQFANRKPVPPPALAAAAAPDWMIGPRPGERATPERVIPRVTGAMQALGTLPPRKQLEDRLAAHPADIDARLGLALIALEHGDSVAEARRIIDARPQRNRVEDSLGETAAWAAAGHLFFFAGELDAARSYYARATANGDGSEADMRREPASP